MALDYLATSAQTEVVGQFGSAKRQALVLLLRSNRGPHCATKRLVSLVASLSRFHDYETRFGRQRQSLHQRRVCFVCIGRSARKLANPDPRFFATHPCPFVTLSAVSPQSYHRGQAGRESCATLSKSVLISQYEEVF